MLAVALVTTRRCAHFAARHCASNFSARFELRTLGR